MSAPFSRAPASPGGPPGGTIGDLLRARAAEGAQRPVLTYLDGVSGERTELGHATFANWVAKTANLLVEELELGAGDRLTVLLPTSWTSVVVVAAAWRAGVVVDLGDGPAGAAVVGEHLRDGSRGEGDPSRLVVVGTGMAGRLTTDPGPALGFAEEVLAFPDEFDDPDVQSSAPALSAGARTWSHADLLADAAAAAERAGLADGERFLSTAGTDTAEGLVAGPLAALAVGGSLVLVTRTDAADLARIAATERCRVVVAG